MPAASRPAPAPPLRADPLQGDAHRPACPATVHAQLDGAADAGPDVAFDAAPDAAHFLNLERRRTQALVQQDQAVLEALHAAHYELITPAGRRFDRQRYLQAVMAAPFYAGWEIDDFRARITPAMAALRYHARLRFPSGRVVNCCHTDVYERLDGRWQAAWSQATEFPA